MHEVNKRRNRKDEEKVMSSSDGGMYDDNVCGWKYSSMGCSGREYRER